MNSEVERFYMAEWSEDAGFGAMDHFVYARDYDALLLKLETMTNDRDAEKHMKANARMQRNKVTRQLNKLRTKKVRDQNGEAFELGQWWIEELEKASITKPMSADLVRACQVALNLTKAVLK